VKGEKFSLGQSVNLFPVEITVDDFMGTNTLVVGQTRSGKSHLTRLLIEGMNGECSQFVFDREGEYVTLREQYDFVVIGDGWDINVSPAVAGELAKRLLAMNASAIIDLSSMKHKVDLEFVAHFIEGLMSLKTNEQSEAMLVFDEAHLLAAESKQTPCGDALLDIAKRGLKRGLFSVFTTQRLPEIAKGVVNQCNNAFTGRAVDIDAQRSAGRLRLNKAQVEQLHTLKRGEFFVAGPAVCDTAMLVKVSDTKTHAPDRKKWKDFKLAPAKGAILKALGELKAVEKEAVEKAKTVDELRTRIRELESKSGADPVEMQKLKQENATLHLDLKRIKWHETNTGEAIRKAIADLNSIVVDSGVSETVGPQIEVSTLPKSATSPKPFASSETYRSLGDYHGLPTGAERMLAFAATRHPHSVTRGQMVAYARISSKSSNVGKFLKLLTEANYLEAKGNGYAATELGCRILPNHEPLPDDPQSKLEAWKNRLAPGAVRMLETIFKHRKLERERVLDLADVSPTSSNAGKFFKQLQEYGLIVIEDGYCKMHEDYR